MSYGPHKGWDFAKFKDPTKPFSYDNVLNDWTVFYPCDGKIIEKRWSTSGGNIYTIDAGEGFRVWMAHFKQQFNTVGTVVYHGDPAGIAGNTPGLPWSDYVHSHVQLYHNGVIINPASYFNLNNMELKPNSVYFSKSDKEYYWIQGNGNVLFVPHDRLVQAALMAISTPTEDSLKDKVIGNF